MSVAEGGVDMAGMKSAYTLEWVSSDGDSCSATDDQGRRTMGRSTKTIEFKVGDTVGIPEWHVLLAYAAHERPGILGGKCRRIHSGARALNG